MGRAAFLPTGCPHTSCAWAAHFLGNRWGSFESLEVDPPDSDSLHSAQVDDMGSCFPATIGHSSYAPQEGEEGAPLGM